MGERAHAEAVAGTAWRSLRRPASTQRQRLLGAIMHVAACRGYEHVTVAQVIARAGVSRATFYRHFDDKEDCFLAALAPLARQLLDDLHRDVARVPPAHAARALVRTLVAFARSRPTLARLLLSDPLTGGGRLRDARDRLVDDAARIVEQAHARLDSRAVVADLPPRLICGLTCRLLASRLRRGDPHPSELADELIAWLAAYELPLARRRWAALAALPPPARSPYLPPSALRPPPPPAFARPRTTAPALAEDEWLRIVCAAAGVIRRDGYRAASVVRIARAAGVDARAFYRLFAGKQQALAAVDELFFRRAMASAAGAFVAGETWARRVWEAARALAQFAEQNPTFAYVALVEGNAGASRAARPVADPARAFAIFLREGATDAHERLGGSTEHPSELALDAIATAVFELAYRHVRAGGEASFSALLAHVVFISLAPFLGADRAADFLELQAHGAAAPTALAASAA
jgi:AcrR family transcriptional regulator